jgi:hypothetical protein
MPKTITATAKKIPTRRPEISIQLIRFNGLKAMSRI